MKILSRKERDKQIRRTDILKAAEHIFALRGYHKATIRDIAKEAQYASGTVYLYFKDKDALYFALLEEKMKDLLSIAKEKASQVKDARKKLEIHVKEALVFFENNQDFFRIFISDENELFAEKNLLKSNTALEMHLYTTSLLKEAQKQGVVSADFETERLADVFSAIVKTIIMKWLQEKDSNRGSLVNLSGLILRLFLNGAAKS
ncbi:MAG: TetR/AcrR family transcriptional regulator [Candidatus Omnitrophica bacterium]|jgi:AcrR family transcriptional regulator|nr:TetR/AcrR family transcriptional regulator [Candidatus Omnitrophota bacterium]